ncbi:MAG: SpoIIE family protein phosphatase [Clostridium sp.]|jgi:stage II sporulation protein E|nr:SpoIIE family protein phosphatase [Clostridium sp.]
MIGKKLHRDMAEVNVYTAKRLREMACSLSGLARAFTDEAGAGRRLSFDEGLAAMQTAASMVCGGCSRCNLYDTGKKEGSYYLYYLIRAFEQKGRVDGEDMPRLFNESCRRQEEYLSQLNRNLGRATMNLTWKNRFLESRDAVIVQFREMASILEEFSGQMERAMDVTGSYEDSVRYLFRRHHIKVENMLMLEYENEQKEAYLTMRTMGGKCVTSRDASDILSRAAGGRRWSVSRDTKSIVTKRTDTFRFVEEGKYQMIHGVSRAVRGGETVSGDSFTFSEGLPHQVIMSLSDGMGSGAAALADSARVVELTEQLLETGFSARAALKLVNTVLLLAGMEQNPATLDLCCVDLCTGVLESMKLGAVGTFFIGRQGIEMIESGSVPMGVMNPVEPALVSRKLWDNDRIIMVSDGVLEALPGEEKEETFRQYLEELDPGNPQDMADEILSFALSFAEKPADDMTVLVGGIFEK